MKAVLLSAVICIAAEPDAPARRDPGSSLARRAHAVTGGQGETVLPLWPGAAPGSAGIEEKEDVTIRGTAPLDRSIRNIHVPTLTVHLPPKERATGVGVVICPGGGYNRVVIDKEGNDVARRLNEMGIAGFVLKFRNPATKAKIYGPNAPYADACRALRLVRGRAKEWNLDPKRIGIMGFSAGGHLASSVGIRFDAGRADAADPIERMSCRPDFLVLVYPMISLDDTIADKGSKKNLLGDNPDPSLVTRLSNELHVTPRTPPTFLVQTSDDSTSPENSIRFYLALRQAKVPAELHLFEKGGHGYGVRPSDLPVAEWPERLREWIKGRGLVDVK